MKHVFTWRLAVLVLTLGVSGCAIQRIHSAADEELAAGKYETAVGTLEAGFKDHPDSTELRSALLKARAEVITRLITAATAARTQGQFDQAEELLARAQRIEPGNLRARELSQALAIERRVASAQSRAQELLSKGQLGDALRIVVEGLKDSPRQPDLLAMQRDLERRLRESKPFGSRLLAESRPVSLDFRDANLRTVLDVVSRNSGINFVLDKDIRNDVRVNIYMVNASVEDALDLIVSSNQLAKKVLDERTILVYPNTLEKQREFQEQVIRVFYLASADAKGAAAFLKSMLKIKEPFIDERSNMLALRESPEAIQVVERLLALYDTGEPEVMLELEVLEVGASRLTDLGLKFPDTVTFTPLPPDGFSSLTVANLRNITGDRVGVSVAGLLLNLKREVGDFEVLANPRIRTKNKEKAKILVGNKVPVITTTTSQNGFVSDNVNYIDVGLKLDLEPVVYADDDVMIKVNLEVSSLADQVKTSTGLIAYQIQTRNAGTTLRLRDGETQVLAGLISREQRSTSSRLPGAGDIPVLGRLFSSQLDNGQRSELVLAITPRVLRNVRPLDASEAEIWIGTENQTRLRSTTSRPAATSSDTTGAPKVPATPGNAPAPAVGSAPLARGTDASPGIPPTLRLNGPAQVKVGQEFSVLMEITAPSDIRGFSLKLSGDETLATVIDVTPGLFFSQDGVAAVPSRSVVDGALQVGVMRQQPIGVNGSGAAAMLRLKALKEGRYEIGFIRAEATPADTSTGASMNAGTGPPLQIDIKP